MRKTNTQRKVVLRKVGMNTLRAAPWLLLLTFLPLVFFGSWTMRSVLATIPTSLMITAAGLPVVFLIAFAAEWTKARAIREEAAPPR
jgi:hypothetical protein